MICYQLFVAKICDYASLDNLISPTPFQQPASMSLSKTLDELLKPEVNRPHRGHDFLLNLAYECTPSFGEAYEQYLNKPLTMLAPNSDDKVIHTSSEAEKFDRSCFSFASL